MWVLQTGSKAFIQQMFPYNVPKELYFSGYAHEDAINEPDYKFSDSIHHAMSMPKKEATELKRILEDEYRDTIFNVIPV